MAYIFQVGFELPADQSSELEIGASLERVLGYLRATLPSEAGFVTSRAMRSVEMTTGVHVVFHTVWETWDDVQAHRQSGLAEDKVLLEFDPHISKEHLVINIYDEID
jgi:heme-degrading monooxygenase HmoA